MAWKLWQLKFVGSCVVIVISLVFLRFIAVPMFSIVAVLESEWGDTEFATTTKCDCALTEPLVSEIEIKSACSFQADRHGLHQKVVSYSFFGDKNSPYYEGIPINAELVSKMYPGWIMRLYHNIGQFDVQGLKDLCSWRCKYPNMDLCYVKELERSFTNLTSTFGTVWRFLVMGDVTVDAFIVRDLDAKIYQREVDAVNEWLAANMTFHVMRDHPFHSDYMLAGMWGARNFNHNLRQMRSLLSDILSHSFKGSKTTDQVLLKKIVWPIANSSMLTHDSFMCQRFKGTQSFPSQRVNGTFVGDKSKMRIPKECPKACRPPNHQEWKYC